LTETTTAQKEGGHGERQTSGHETKKTAKKRKLDSAGAQGHRRRVNTNLRLGNLPRKGGRRGESETVGSPIGDRSRGKKKLVREGGRKTLTPTTTPEEKLQKRPIHRDWKRGTGSNKEGATKKLRQKT